MKLKEELEKRRMIPEPKESFEEDPLIPKGAKHYGKKILKADKFAIEFPSLKGKGVANLVQIMRSERGLRNIDEKSYEEIDKWLEEHNIIVFKKEAIQKHCIDKQRVRDALEVIKSIANMIPCDLLCNAGRNEKMYLKQTLHKTIDLKKKELGLEDD